MENVLLHLTDNQNNKYELKGYYFSILYPYTCHNIFFYFKF